MRVNYTVACQDTNHPQGEAVVPARYRAVKIRLVQGATQTTLATVDTDREGYLSARVTIPASAKQVMRSSGSTTLVRTPS